MFTADGDLDLEDQDHLKYVILKIKIMPISARTRVHFSISVLVLVLEVFWGTRTRKLSSLLDSITACRAHDFFICSKVHKLVLKIIKQHESAK